MPEVACGAIAKPRAAKFEGRELKKRIAFNRQIRAVWQEFLG